MTEKKQSRQNALIICHYNRQYTVTLHIMTYEYLIIPNKRTTTGIVTRKVSSSLRTNLPPIIHVYSCY